MISVAKPSIGRAELVGIESVLKSGWLGMGSEVFQFENELKKIFKRRYAICVNTGTTAIHLALDALGIKDSDEVIVPSLTFIGTVQPILLCRAKPIFCDISLDDLNMNVEDLERLITKRTKAIIPVHYGGASCNMDEILKIGRRHNIHIVEDAAHAFGSKYNGRLIGSFGNLTCFSFDPIKNITCGEGGAIVLDDTRIAQAIIKKRILGIDKDTWNRYKHKRSWLYEVHMMGFRYHMSNINAAIGIVQLKRFEAFAKKRRVIARFYDRALSSVREIALLKHDYKECVPFNYTILAKKRDELMVYLEKRGIGTVINYIPNHLQPIFGRIKTRLANTETAYKKIVSIPLHAAMALKDANSVVEAIKDFYKLEI